MIDTSSVDPVRFNRFVRALVSAQKQIEKAKKKKQPVEKHIEKMKDFPYANPHVKKLVTKEIDEINAKLDEVLREEKELESHQTHDDVVIKAIKKEISSVDKSFKQFREDFSKVIEERDRQIHTIADSVDEIDSRLKAGAGKRVIELEKKIREKVEVEESELVELDKRIKKMESHVKKLEKKKEHPKSDIKRIKDKIGILKKRLNSMK